MKPRKIAIVTFLYDTDLGGGAAKAARDLAEGLAGEGNEVVVITSSAQPGVSIEHQNKIKVYRYFPKNLYWVAQKDSQRLWKKMVWQTVDIWNPHSFITLKKILFSEKPDIVHVHKLRGVSPAVWSAARSVKTPVLVQTLHDYEIISPDGLLQGNAGQLAANRSPFLFPYQQIRRSFSKLVAAVTSPSEYTLDLHTRLEFFPRSIRQVIPNSHGFSLKELENLQIQTRSQPCDVEEVRLLYLGRLEEEKGINLLCHTFSDIATSYPLIHLDIAGWGSQEDRLKQKYMKLPQLHFYGPVFGEEKRQLLANCTALIVPSTVPEVFGIGITEAYAYGKSVIASKVGGIPEIVDDTKTGLLFTPGNQAALAETLIWTAENSSYLHTFQDNCFQKAKSFSTEQILNQYLDLYQKTLGKVCL